MTGRTCVEMKRWDHRWAAVVFAALLLSTLALAFAFIAEPARAIDDDPCPTCEPSENNPPTVDRTNASVADPAIAETYVTHTLGQRR